ncbi:unnamed protein product, partial [Adineta steineri]
DDEHIAFYGRAKTYKVLKQFDKALTDIEQVILLKPYWAKGYYCRSEILFEMKCFTPALLSSLQGLTIDPDDQIGKQIMARHLHTVLHNNDDKQDVTKAENDLNMFPSTNNTNKQVMTSNACDSKLHMCKSTPLTPCLCALFDSEHINARDYDCSICVNLIWFPITTPCGHIFCR